jgi:Fe2+ or Zn2+ uptake regulation protein
MVISIILWSNDRDYSFLKEIREACPDISKVTVERTMTSLVKQGYLVKIGAGRSVAYGKTDKQK